MSIVTELDLLKYRRTKIAATIGPASNSEDVVADLISAGVNVFRVNMSHESHEGHAEAIKVIRHVAKPRRRSPRYSLISAAPRSALVSSTPASSNS